MNSYDLGGFSELPASDFGTSEERIGVYKAVFHYFTVDLKVVSLATF